MPRVAITISGKSPQPYRFQLNTKKVSIGRSEDNDITIACPSVSSLHCTMERVDGGYILRDRHSTNGISLGDDDMAIIDLRNDSEIKVGDVKFEYTLSDEELDEIDDEDFVPQAKTVEETAAEPEEKSTPTKKPKANVVTPPRQPATPFPPTVLASTNQGSGGLYGIALFVCGVAAFYAGLDHSYSGKQRDAGRKGDFSLLSDISKGRPTLPSEEESKGEGSE
ncbi:FHA domain-containing protein [Akkermansiaceae bacterium]|nr:FHA domain-containing protein [Akkermansiaceae bacterium]MDA7661530.1 FHA domain-containing protein [bacterium]MDB4708046.1 FHA domain-containing protein [Akkermansiaceae bacterium]MDB4723688.1 FHA domain-containing protein [Akkermansiaceae bacterium]MDC0270886.1 FHA domain-containing protein [Akkermansiaceae bacterium]